MFGMKRTERRGGRGKPIMSARAGIQRGWSRPQSSFRWYYLTAVVVGSIATAAIALDVWLPDEVGDTLLDPPTTTTHAAEDCAVPYTKTVHGIIADISDKLSGSNQEDWLRQAATDAIDRTRRGTTVLIAGLGDTSSVDPLERVYSGCNPGSSSDYDVFRTTAPAAAQAYDIFRRGAVANLDSHFAPDEKDYSPICEGIAAMLRHPAMLNADNRSMTVLSDLLYHSVDGTTVYRNSRSFYENFPSICRVDLTDVTIKLEVIRRDHPAQTEELIAYWVDELTGLGATVTHTYR